MRPRRTVTLDTIANQIDGLCRYMDSLGNSMSRLSARLVPYADEEEILQKFGSGWKIPTFPRSGELTLEQIFSVLKSAANRIDGMERDFNSVRAKIDALESGGMLKDEIKRWVKATRSD